MRLQNGEQLEKQIEQKLVRRQKKAKPLMKVSGASVKKLFKIIKAKG